MTEVSDIIKTYRAKCSMQKQAWTGSEKPTKKICKKFQKKVLTSCGRYDSISTLRVQQHRTQDTAP